MLSAVDILSAANMVNFFGTVETIEQIPLHPILMVKGDTKLALYGLGNVRDERLSRMIEQDALKWKRDSNSVEDCFNMFVLHQNRPDKGRGASNCVKEEHLPDWLDLVMWGHEHECMISPFRSASDTYYITQPGSSVATSLIEGEAVQKKMALLQVRDKNFKFKTHTLPHGQAIPHAFDITRRLRAAQ